MTEKVRNMMNPQNILLTMVLVASGGQYVAPDSTKQIDDRSKKNEIYIEQIQKEQQYQKDALKEAIREFDKKLDANQKELKELIKEIKK